MKSLLKLLVLTALLGYTALICAQAPPFSADMIVTMVMDPQSAAMMEKAGMKPTQTMKLYVSGLKMRIEGGSGPQQTLSIADFSPNGSVYLISLANHTYLEMSHTADMKSNLGKLADFLKYGGDPCAIHDDNRVSCQKTDMGAVDGRPCQNYKLVRKSEPEQTLCLDSKLHFPLRTSSKSSSSEVNNIKEGSQPASLFALPPGLKKQELPHAGS